MGASFGQAWPGGVGAAGSTGAGDERTARGVGRVADLASGLATVCERMRTA